MNEVDKRGVWRGDSESGDVPWLNLLSDIDIVEDRDLAEYGTEKMLVMCYEGLEREQHRHTVFRGEEEVGLITKVQTRYMVIFDPTEGFSLVRYTGTQPGRMKEWDDLKAMARYNFGQGAVVDYAGMKDWMESEDEKSAEQMLAYFLSTVHGAPRFSAWEIREFIRNRFDKIQEDKRALAESMGVEISETDDVFGDPEIIKRLQDWVDYGTGGQDEDDIKSDVYHDMNQDLGFTDDVDHDPGHKDDAWGTGDQDILFFGPDGEPVR